MLKVNEVKQQLLIGLTDYFANEGFSYRKTTHEFVKELNGVKYKIFIPLTSFTSSVYLGVSIYIRFNKVEDILNKIIGSSDTFTIGNEIGLIFNSPNGRDYNKGDLSFFLTDEDSIISAITYIKFYYENIMLPYFSRYNNLDTLNDIFNNEPFDYCPVDVGGSLGERCKKGLIIARLVGINIYDNLVTVYDKEILETNDNAINEYQKVREYLKYNEI